MKNLKFIAKQAAKKQIKELKKINRIFNKSFLKAIELIHNCQNKGGHVLCAGVGKSEIAANRTSKLFSSIGIPSFPISSQNFSHGDAGSVTKKDILLVFSYSGDSIELTDLINFASRYRIPLIGVAAKENSLLLKSSSVKLLLPKVSEVDPTGLVPTSSFSLIILAMDCLAVCLMQKSKFTETQFRKFHSGGSIGKKLLTCGHIMQTKKLPIVSTKKTIGETIKIITKGSLGVAVITKAGYKVAGYVTDGQIRKSKFSKRESIMKISTKKPIYVSENTLVSKAISLMNQYSITSLPVSNEKEFKKGKASFKLRGIVHMHHALRFQ